MWKNNIRPHGEFFAINQKVENGLTTANVIEANSDTPLRLDASQGATAVRLVIAKDTIASVPSGTAIGLVLFFSSDITRAEECFVTLRAMYEYTDVDDLTLPDGYVVCEIVLPESIVFQYPYVAAYIDAANISSDIYVDIFPHYISQPRR